MQYAKGCFKAGLCPAFCIAFQRGGSGMGARRLTGFIRLLIWAASVQKGKACACRRRGEIAQGGNIVLQKNAKKGDMVRIVHLPSGHGVI